MKIILLIVATILGSNLNSAYAQTNQLLKGELKFNKQQLSIKVDIAVTEADRQTGLMFQTQLASDHGMLFVFNDQAIRGVWMKNTLIPLDVIFLNDQAVIVSMLTKLQPCQQSPCPSFSSEQPASYMLEMNAGFISEHQIKIGEKLSLPF